MNKIYRLIWDAQNNAFVAVSENTKAKGKKSSKTLLAMALVSSLGIFVTNSAMAACNPLAISSFDNCESASTSASTSASSALDSAFYAGSASTYAGSASTSASTSARSATAASTSASTSASSALESAGSATAASTSASTSARSATAASRSATAASRSATASANSATASANSALDSAFYAGSASTSAGSATASATASASSASSALDSATAASTSASTATERVNYIEHNIDAIFRDSNTYADLSNRIDQNSSDIRSNRKLAAQGIAGLAAMTNIPSPAIAGTTSIGAGVGYFDSESAIAIGASHYFENNVSIKGSVASGFNSGKSTVVGAGVSYTWK